MTFHNLTVAVLGGETLAGRLGKKGSEGDVIMYNSKKGDDVVVYLTPARYPERPRSLAFSLSMADVAVLCVNTLDRDLGERLVALDSFGIRRGYLVVGENIYREDLDRIIKGTVVENYVEHSGEAATLREEMFGLDSHLPADGPARVDVSHHFKVKGVGTVVLGSVAHGTVRQHDAMTVYPTGKTCSIRSIQVQDHDTKEAGPGARVGCALKGVEPEDLDKGFVLAPADGYRTLEELSGRLVKSPFYRGPLGPGTVVHVVERLQFIPGRVVEVSGEEITIALEKPLIAGPVDFPRVLLNIDSPVPRFIGRLD